MVIELHTDDGTRLSLRRAGPRRPRLEIVVVHGAAEHCGRYGHLRDHLVRHELAVTSFDLRGHGQSSGRRMHVERFDDYVDDLACVVRHVASTTDAPIICYGHSMGALVCSRFAARDRSALAAGLVLTGAPFRLGMVVPRLKVVVGQALARILPRMRTRLDLSPGGISSDAAAVQAYRSDSQIQSRATLRWGSEFLSAVDASLSCAPKIELRTLVAHGEDDPIAALSGARDFVARARVTPKFLTFAGARHELHNEQSEVRDAFLAGITSWLIDEA